MKLQPGKLPAPMLAQLLATIDITDPRVLVGPGIGRDAAVIDAGAGRLLVAKTDPITFATEHIGWYAAHVNANDIACMGARPAWMLATALLPPHSDPALPASIFTELNDACRALGVALVGGHMEVTAGVDHPIIAGAMIGEATRDEIVTGEGVQSGDAVLLTKGIAIEGTSLLARESARVLLERGLATAVLERARQFLFEPGISIVPDARAVMSACRPRLMHDPTEGGIVTALHEMAQSAGATLAIDLERVPVLAETRVICDAAGINPFGLLSSGALLAIIPPESVTAVTSALARVKIDGRIIGRVETGAPEAIMEHGDGREPLPAFDRDELARFYGSNE